MFDYFVIKNSPHPINRKKATFYFIICVCIALLIFIFSHLPGEESSTQSGRLLKLLNFIGINITSANRDFIHTIIRKLAHITEYFLLTFTYYKYRYYNNFKKIIIPTILFSTLYAISDEFHQSFIPGRGPSIYDVFIDSIGIYLAILINIIHKKK